MSTISLGGLLEYLDSGVSLLEMGAAPRLLYASPSFCRLLGVEEGEYEMPCPVSRLVHPDDQAGLLRALEQGLKQGGIVEHIHRVSPDGEPLALVAHSRGARAL